MSSVSILCTDSAHPINQQLRAWAEKKDPATKVDIFRDWRELTGGDFLFLVSCQQIIRKPIRDLFRYTLVLHASALPQGRGMSPHVWQILQGAKSLCVTLLNAEDELDSGDIWHQIELSFEGTELHDEIHETLFAAEMALMSWALDNCDKLNPRPQFGEPSYLRRRSPEDSEIDPTRPLVESFDLLRIADPDRYPAFFEYRGCKYRIRIDKL